MAPWGLFLRMWSPELEATVAARGTTGGAVISYRVCRPPAVLGALHAVTHACERVIVRTPAALSTRLRPGPCRAAGATVSSGKLRLRDTEGLVHSHTAWRQ
jgi:hypothetical protein